MLKLNPWKYGVAQLVDTNTGRHQLISKHRTLEAARRAAPKLKAHATVIDFSKYLRSASWGLGKTICGQLVEDLRAL